MRYRAFLLFCFLPSFLAAKDWPVPAGADLQSALQSAKLGDTVTLQAGATWTGQWILPATNAPATCSASITIRSSDLAALPAGVRVNGPQASGHMPKLQGNQYGWPILVLSTGANCYQLQGLELLPSPGIYNNDLLQHGTGAETTNAAVPHDLEVDRCYLHGDPTAGAKRGIGANGSNLNVHESYFSQFISTWQDTQAIAGWNGPGPFTITNNYLAAGGETVAFGGATPANVGNIPSDILVQYNDFDKPLSWRPGDPSYAGIPVRVKNQIEFKFGQRAVIDSNVFTNNWIAADQFGFVFVLGVRDEGGQVPWATVNNIKITNNHSLHSAAGILLMGHDADGGGNLHDLDIENNLFEDVGNGGDGRFFEVISDAQNVTLKNNTARESGWLYVFAAGLPSSINSSKNLYYSGSAIGGEGYGAGPQVLTHYSPNGSFTDNVIVWGQAYQYPAGNWFLSDPSQAGQYPGYGASLPAATMGNSAVVPATATTPKTTPLIPTGTTDVPSGWVNIVGKQSGLCLADPASSLSPGTPMIQWTCNGLDDQKWQVTAVSGGYEITNKRSGLQLDISGGPSVVNDGASLIQWPYWGGTNEIFALNRQSDGSYQIVVTSSGKLLDVTGQSLRNGTLVEQWVNNGGDNQKWILKPVQ